MGKPWREEYYGGIYHVIARGNNMAYIFKESFDKGYFIKLLKESMEGIRFRIYGYVLMYNHEDKVMFRMSCISTKEDTQNVPLFS
ncbi:MAG: hypothetical protein A2Y23_13915 [Clostridiales bacterium GWB2_37_7]|nr:MAG: hypothetical protein A2Y23_13915 [Clostridiales bacterium GWB2_37_7]